jgi:hypothetical protein
LAIENLAELKLKPPNDKYLFMVTLRILKRILVVCLVLLVVVTISILVFEEPINKYLGFSGEENAMKTLMQPQQLDAVRASISDYFGASNRNYSLQDLFQWQNAHLKYVNNFPWSYTFYRPNDPIGILKAGIGRCGEFSVLFTAACLAEGYDARIALVIKSDYSTSAHEFCEVKINGTWTQVDSSWYMMRLVVNETSVYEKSGWWPLQQMGYSIFDFDQKHAYNITSYFVQ